RHVANGAASTTLTAPADVVPLTLTGSTSAKASTVADFTITAKDAAIPGGSSIAVLALAEANALILRSTLISGNGANGANGADGDHFVKLATAGLPGNDGTSACSATIGLGGAAVGLVCDDGSKSFSGKGGNGGELFANPGGDGQDMPDPN